MRVPKLQGFNNPFRVEYQAINLDTIEESGLDEVTPETLRAKGLVHKGALVKVLGRGELTRKVTVKAHAFSKSAEAAITAAGGTRGGRCPLPWGDGRPPRQGQRPHQPLIGVDRSASTPTVPTAADRRSTRALQPAEHFKVPDLRNKILFTLLMIALYRLGAYIPVPGIDLDAVQRSRSRPKQGGVLGFLQLFSGGALTQFAVFALGIMPYITSSIIMQILTVVIPKLEQWQEQGAVGQRKITQWTRYLTVGIAVMQSTGLVFLFHNGGGGFVGSEPPTSTWSRTSPSPRVLLIVVTLTAGTALLMWMGELITQRGIGNGMSLLIFTSVVSRCPSHGSAGSGPRPAAAALVVLLILFVVLMVAIVFVEQGQRRIPVQFAKRVVGRRMYGGQSTYIPLKVNQSGVIPIIFASSVLYLPLLLSQRAARRRLGGATVQEWINDNLVQLDQPLLHRPSSAC